MDTHNPRLRVLMIYSTTNLGGAEVYALNLLEALRNDATFLVASPEGSFLGQRARKLQVNAFDVPITYPAFDITPLTNTVGLIMAEATKFKPDLIHVHHLPAAIAGSLVGFSLDVPMLFTIDSAFIRESYRNFIRSIPCSVMALSQSGYDALRSTTANRQPVFLALPGINLQRFPIVDENRRQLSRRCFGLGKDKFVVGVAARLTEEKGIQHVIEAIALLPEATRSKIQLLIAGAGEFGQKLKQFAHVQGVLEFVQFLGMLEPEDMHLFFACLDLFIVASKREGLPLTLLEAIATGVPVIGTRVGDIPSLLSIGYNGYLIELNNEPISLQVARAIKKTLCQRKFSPMLWNMLSE